MVTHTEGPSNVEDNGSLGIMGVLHYYSKIPAGRSSAHDHGVPRQPPLRRRRGSRLPVRLHAGLPGRGERLVGGLAMEHFGGMQFNEVGDEYKATGWPAHTSVYTFPNPLAIETAIAIVKEVKQQRANVAAPPAAGLGNVYNKLGVNGQSQGFWYGPNFMTPFVEHGRLPGFPRHR
jgi:hypothetical protein